MNNFMSDVKRFLGNRFSGKISKDIADIKESLKIIKDPPPDGNFWLSWYIDYQKMNLPLRLKFFQKARFIPGRFLRTPFSGSGYTKAIEKIVKNDKIIFKDITLPSPVNSSDISAYINGVILDGLLQYLLDDMDKESFYSLIFPEGPYEYKEVQLEKGDIVIDAGSNVGEFSALAGVKGCKAYAFEPMPNVIETYLSKTAEWNPNVTVCQYALSDKKCELVFSQNSMSSSSFVTTSIGRNRVKVKAIDLDTFVEENNLPSVDFLKADIEGAERYMLMGAKRVLKEFSPKIAICTYHLPDDPKILRELILDANPNYVIEERWKKMYAYVPK